MGFWHDIAEKRRWERQVRKEKRKEEWNLFKKQLTCKHSYRVVQRRQMIEQTTNPWTGKSWTSDHWIDVVYCCDECGKTKTVRE